MIYNEDCIAGMRKRVLGGSVDLIITDPPFGIPQPSSAYNRKSTLVLNGYVDVPEDLPYGEFSQEWLQEAWRVLKPSGSAYILSGWTHLKDVLVALDGVGFTLINHIIWKYQFGLATKHKFVTSHYHILYVCKNPKRRVFYPFARYGLKDRDADGRSLYYADKEDVWVIPREYWRGQIRTRNKLPARLVEKMLLYSSREGDTVLDPFAGSGQVLCTAKSLGRKPLGFEISKIHYEFALKRLEAQTWPESCPAVTP